MKKRAYFMDMRLKSGKYVTVIYESASRKGTQPHMDDLWFAVYGNLDIDWNYEFNHRPDLFAFVLNEKNKDEQCFGDFEVVDMR